MIYKIRTHPEKKTKDISKFIIPKEVHNGLKHILKRTEKQ
jgi:hypothetical protein